MLIGERQKWTRPIISAIGILIAMFMISACGSGGSKSVKTVTVSASASQSASDNDSAVNTDSASSSDSASTSAPDDAPSTDTSSSGQVVISSAPGGRILTLDDACCETKGDWKTDRYSISGKANLNGIGAKIGGGCGDDYAATLEFRLAHNFTTLKFSAGQDNASTASDLTLVVKVLANDRQIELQKIPFDSILLISKSVADVNALKIVVYVEGTATSQYCSDSIIGVITGLTVS